MTIGAKSLALQIRGEILGILLALPFCVFAEKPHWVWIGLVPNPLAVLLSKGGAKGGCAYKAHPWAPDRKMKG